MFSGAITDFITALTEFVAGLDSWQQLGALMLVSAIPFVESYTGSFLGVLVGINPFVAVAAAVIGNTISTFLLIAAAGGARGAATKNRAPQEPPSKRRQKIATYFDRFGVPGVSLLGPLALPSQFTAPAMVGLGASKRSVYFWMFISIVAWGVLFGFFSNLVVDWLY